MKKLIPLFFLLFFFKDGFAQTTGTVSPFNERDSIEVVGKIINYKAGQEDHFISFSNYNLLGLAVKQAIQIADNGEFWIKLYQPFDGDIQLNYKDAYVDIYVKAGKTLHLTIYNDKVTDDTNYETAFVAKGELAGINNLMFKFFNAYHQQQFPSTDYDKALSDSLFATKQQAALTDKLNFLNSFIKSNRITDETFINWQSNQLKYTTAKEIIFFPFLGKLNKEITQEKLLALLKPIPLNNSTAFHNSIYYNFLSSLISSQQIIFNINPLYENVKVAKEGNTVGLALDLVDSYATGLTKELLYSISYQKRGSAKADPKAFQVRFEQTINNTFLKKGITAAQLGNEHKFDAYNVISRLEKLKVSPVLKQRLIKLFTQYKGTNLYIDFWGDWCGPCMSELPNYPALIAALATKPVQFLFLSTFTTEKSMLAIKEKFKINGDFINLNKDEVAIVNNIFGFHSYPSHFLVDKTGTVIQKMYKTYPNGAKEKAQDILSLINNPKN